MSEDRRRYFRIDDTLGLSFRVLSDQELTDTDSPGSTGDVHALLSRDNERIEQLLEATQQESPSVHALCRALNDKLDSLIDQLAMDNRTLQALAHKVYQVNISACGLAVTLDEPLTTGAQLALEMQLLPDNSPLALRAQVVGCDATREGHYYVRLDFVDIDEPAQERLIQHIVRREGQMLQRQRNERDEAEDAADDE